MVPSHHPPSVCRAQPRTSGSRRLEIGRLSDLLRVSLIDRQAGDTTARLADESALMREYGASRDVIRAALALLADEGLIERRRGRGTLVVSTTRTVDGRLPDDGDSLAEHVGDAHMSSEVLRWEHVPAPPVVAARLDGVVVGDDILCMTYVLHAHGRPMGVITNHLRSPEADGLTAEEFDGDFYALLDDHGVDVASHDIDLSAHPAAPWVADTLQVAPASPVQVFEQTIRDTTGARVDFAIGRIRPGFPLRITGVGRMATAGPTS